jgi:glycosyltransferase involved in cell wall biosynthesis
MNDKRQKKILEIITKSNFGGAQKYVFELATALDKDGYDVSVAFGGAGVLKEKLEEARINTIQIKSLARDINIFSEFKAFFQIIKIILKEKPDVVHLNSSKVGAIGAVAARLCRVKRITFTIHGLAFNENRSWISKIVIKKIYWLTIALSHTSIAVSENVKKQLTRNFFFKLISRKIIVIKNGIKQVDFIEKNHARSLITEKINDHLHGRNIVATIAELHHIKGLQYLVEAAAKITKENKDVIFVVFGSGQ